MRATLPAEDFIYLADSGHVPYGTKSQEYIRTRSLILTQFLLEHGVKAIVIACNTATAAAASHVRSSVNVPVVAMEPAVKPAAAATRSGVIGVLATTGTLENSRFAGLLERYGQEVKVVSQSAPGLVEQVEAGDLSGPRTRALIEEYTVPLLRAGADTVVLGCTHYPFLRPLIADVVGQGITLIDTGAAVARQLRRVLDESGLLNRNDTVGTEAFWTSADAEQGRIVASRLWGSPVSMRRLPDGVA